MINIDELTLGQIKELQSAFNNTSVPQKKHGAVGKFCIVRTHVSGVHAGIVEHVGDNDGRSRCTLKNSRRLWYWQAKESVSLSALAQGIDLNKSKICPIIAEHYLEDAIEFIPAENVKADIMGAKDYDRS